MGFTESIMFSCDGCYRGSDKWMEVKTYITSKAVGLDVRKEEENCQTHRHPGL